MIWHQRYHTVCVSSLESKGWLVIRWVLLVAASIQPHVSLNQAQYLQIDVSCLLQYTLSLCSEVLRVGAGRLRESGTSERTASIEPSLQLR